MIRLLMHMLWEYHGERWPVLLTDILKNALRAAYLSTSIQDYLTLALEALGPSTTFSEERQAFIYNNVTNILQVEKKKKHFYFMCRDHSVCANKILNIAFKTEKATESRAGFARRR